MQPQSQPPFIDIVYFYEQILYRHFLRLLDTFIHERGRIILNGRAGSGNTQEIILVCTSKNKEIYGDLR